MTAAVTGQAKRFETVLRIINQLRWSIPEARASFEVPSSVWAAVNRMSADRIYAHLTIETNFVSDFLYVAATFWN